ncbi:MAG: hypothetical protein KG012_15660 [Deltaproteobacteria bacterium]|nr:hypothetical protein [Deltaproteobacteria bacterium]
MSKSMKKILTILSLALVLAIALGSLGVAYAGGIRGIGLLGVAYAGGIRGIGLLGVWFFLTFGVIVVLAQVIPAGILLSSLVVSTLSSDRREEAPVGVI